MRSLIRLTDCSEQDVYRIFRLADEMREGKHRNLLTGKSAVMFFPASSIRTRVTFEKGVHLLGGQPILFPSDALDKKEDIRDVCGYLANWADLVVVRHRDIGLVSRMAELLPVPVINAMTDVNHPCEILADLYALSRLRRDFRQDRYLFVGARGNIGLAWQEAAKVMGLDLTQCCPPGYELPGLTVHRAIDEAVRGKDVICTDALPSGAAADFRDCQVTLTAMAQANDGAVLNPCPPFCRDEEVSAEVIDSPYFVGYGFKEHLLAVQQAIVAWCLEGGDI